MYAANFHVDLMLRFVDKAVRVATVHLSVPLKCRRLHFSKIKKRTILKVIPSLFPVYCCVRQFGAPTWDTINTHRDTNMTISYPVLTTLGQRRGVSRLLTWRMRAKCWNCFYIFFSKYLSHGYKNTIQLIFRLIAIVTYAAVFTKFVMFSM